jgi:hypothetical protein
MMTGKSRSRIGGLTAMLALGSASACSQSSPTGTAAGGGGAPVDQAGASGNADTVQDSGVPCLDPADGGLPDDVFCIGLYKGRDSTKYSADAVPYTPGVTFWSDGAQKQRYFYLPPGTKIDTSNIDAWKFPVGTKAWKEFRFDDKLVETRLFWKVDETNWASGTYIWDADGRAAPLNTSKKPVLLANGYEIPTAKDCGKCHHGAADYLLGLEAVELGLPTAMGVTLAKLTAAGSLSHPLAETTIHLPEDSTGKAAAALGYLHANCGMPCHSNRGLGHETELLMRLRADEFWSASGSVTIPAVTSTDIYAATVMQKPTTASVEQKFPGQFRVTPGSHDKSLVWTLAHTRGQYQMPPLVSHVVDDTGTQKLGDWIDALAPPP